MCQCHARFVPLVSRVISSPCSVTVTDQPGLVIEVGGGYSTLLVDRALARNRAEQPDRRARHVCIEPYENPWLERPETWRESVKRSNAGNDYPGGLPAKEK